jgi:hypothetical protein
MTTLEESVAYSYSLNIFSTCFTLRWDERSVLSRFWNLAMAARTAYPALGVKLNVDC